MTSANKRFAQKAIAVVVIVTMLYGAGVAPLVMMFVTGVVLVVFLFSRRAQNREVERIFDFYLAADSILRDEDRRWYGFEVADVIEEGEFALDGMLDPPPLHLFTLGALHHLIGNHSATVEYLSRVIENEEFDERKRAVPSLRLRRYVTLLRRIEAEPSLAPQTLGAVRSLERMRRRHGASFLQESRKALTSTHPKDEVRLPQTIKSTEGEDSATHPNRNGAVMRPPIGDVLKDIYQDDQSPAN